MPPFETGNQFSAGHPRGARNKATQKVIRAVQKEAESGNIPAAALVLARTWPRGKGQPVQIELPPVTDTSGLVAAQAAVIAAMAGGEISPEEA